MGDEASSTGNNSVKSSDSKQVMSAQERKAEIAAILDKGGYHSMKVSEMARRFGVSHTQIDRDISELMSERPKLNWSALLNQSLLELEAAIGIVHKAIQDTSDTKKRGSLAAQMSEMTLRKALLLEKMERLIPASSKPEPIRVVYCCVDSVKQDKNDVFQKEEPEVNLSGVPTNG